MTDETAEFAKILVEEVRDRAIQGCDLNLDPEAQSLFAKRWRTIIGNEREADVVRQIIPECVDRTICALLRAIDDGRLQLRWKREDGDVVDLSMVGEGEMVGWYLGDDGWRKQFSKERSLSDQ